MIKRYKTVYRMAEGEIIEKKSRFIATVMPVEKEEEAVEFLESMRKKYWNATHNCFAYVIGHNNEIQRYGDDGEPSGTAGMPMLDVLRGEMIRNTAVVVTRYFGGTLLGTGGLVRAYSSATKEGLNNSLIIEKILYKRILITVDYATSGKIQYIIAQNNINLLETLYTEQVSFEVLTEVDDVERFKNTIIEATNANAILEEFDTTYAADVEGTLMLFDK